MILLMEHGMKTMRTSLSGISFWILLHIASTVCETLLTCCTGEKLRATSMKILPPARLDLTP